MHEGVNGLLRDKSRPPGKAPIAVDGATRKRARGPPCRQTPSDRLDDSAAEDHSRNNAPCLTPK